MGLAQGNTEIRYPQCPILIRLFRVVASSTYVSASPPVLVIPTAHESFTQSDYTDLVNFSFRAMLSLCTIVQALLCLHNSVIPITATALPPAYHGAASGEVIIYNGQT